MNFKYSIIPSPDRWCNFCKQKILISLGGKWVKSENRLTQRWRCGLCQKNHELRLKSLQTTLKTV